ncbi:hypothetical protein M407DRAFT_101209, partial [Tulasnella calospora MUT 4182]
MSVSIPTFSSENTSQLDFRALPSFSRVRSTHTRSNLLFSDRQSPRGLGRIGLGLASLTPTTHLHHPRQASGLSIRIACPLDRDPRPPLH